MMYYICRPSTWSPANRKCAELIEYVNTYKGCLIADEKALDALVGGLRAKVEELNLAHPRTRELTVEMNASSKFLSCQVENSDRPDDYVFTIDFHPVNSTLMFSEETGLLFKDGSLDEVRSENEDKISQVVDEVADMLESTGLVEWAERIVREDRVQDVRNRFYNLTHDEKTEAIEIARGLAKQRRGDDAGDKEEGGAI